MQASDRFDLFRKSDEMIQKEFTFSKEMIAKLIDGKEVIIEGKEIRYIFKMETFDHEFAAIAKEYLSE